MMDRKSLERTAAEYAILGISWYDYYLDFKLADREYDERQALHLLFESIYYEHHPDGEPD